MVAFSHLALQGKLDTEKLLTDKGVTFTSVRPVYIYGPLNYNPVEEWFFHRIKAGRPIPVPNSGQQVNYTAFTVHKVNLFLRWDTTERLDMLLYM